LEFAREGDVLIVTKLGRLAWSVAPSFDYQLILVALKAAIFHADLLL
jgi:hypothetical protein